MALDNVKVFGDANATDRVRYKIGDTRLKAASNIRSVFITPSRVEGVAPAGFFFRADAYGFDLPSRHCRFKWTFGDPNSKPFDKLTRSPVLWGTNSNVAFLDCAAHTYHPSPADFDAATPDGQPPAEHLDFTATVEVTDGTNTLTRNVTVRVRNPDFVFQGDATVIVAQDGDFTGAPTDPYGGTYATTTALPGSANGRRVLLKAGVDYALSGSFKFGGYGSANAAQLGVWGTGSRPRLTGLTTASDTMIDHVNAKSTEEASCWGFDMGSTWRGVDESELGGVDTWRGFKIACPGPLTLHDLNIENVDKSIVNSTDVNTVVMTDCLVYDFRDFGIFLSNSYIFALAGVRVERPLDARGGAVGALGDRGVQHDHGPLRNSAPASGGVTLLSQVEFYSNAGWSSGNGYENHPQGDHKRPSHQPNLRFNTGNEDLAGLRIDRCVFEGGNAVLNITGNKGLVSRIDAIADKLILISSGNTSGGCLGIEHYGVVVRNFIAVVPPTATPDAYELKPDVNILSVGDNGGDYSQASYQEIYSGTLLDWTPDERLALRNQVPKGTPLVPKFDNVLHHAPNYPSPLDLSANLEFVRLFAPQYPGLKWYNRFAEDFYNTPSGDPAGTPHEKGHIPDSPTLDPSSATLDTFDQGGVTVASVSMPVPNVGAFPAGPGLVALDDITGTLRGSQPSAGAVEPEATLPV